MVPSFLQITQLESLFLKVANFFVSKLILHILVI